MTEYEKCEECISNLIYQIGWIEDIDSHKFPGWGHTVNAMRQAIYLLKAQEPVEPKLDVDECRCGKCGHKLEHQELFGDNVLFHEQYNYCPNCGRAVKWK